jgi:hypothetical protein
LVKKDSKITKKAKKWENLVVKLTIEHKC